MKTRTHKTLALGALSLSCALACQPPGPADLPDTPRASGSPAGEAAGAGSPMAADCPASALLDLSDVEGPGDAYGAPRVAATCDGEVVEVTANGLPHYAFQPVTPNALSAQEHVWQIPQSPAVAAASTDIPLLGTIGFAINGIPMYGPNEGPQPDPFGDPVFNEILDWCLGHTAQAGDYHYHALVESCFYGELPDSLPSPVLGFALDGFPIYGPRGCVDADCAEVATLESSWVQTGDPTTYAWDNHTCDSDTCDTAAGNKLDRCNGRVGPDGTYRYHATDSFPYILGCYRGTPLSAGGGSGAEGGPSGAGGRPADHGEGPAACEVQADCEGACPPDAVGCACGDTPMGSRCIPTCERDADCPAGRDGETLTCQPSGVCAPAGPR